MLNLEGKNVVLGTLSSGKVDQMTLDLIFDREFKLSHTSTSCSVFFCGYRTDKQQEYEEESEEGILVESIITKYRCTAAVNWT